MEELARLGQLHVSNEFSTAVAFAIGLIVLYFAASNINMFFYSLMANVFSSLDEGLERGIFNLLNVQQGHILTLVALLLTFPLISVILVFFQTRGNLKENLFQLNTSVLNPLNGLRRLLSLNHLFFATKAIAKLIIVVVVFYIYSKARIEEIMFGGYSDLNSLAGKISWSAFQLLCIGGVIMILFGGIDFFVGYLLWLRSNRMTKQEVKDDRRASEGDETVKRTIYSKGSKLVLQKMRKSIATSTVLVVNPTHYAIALRYNRGQDDAPVVTAKGVDFLALKMREIAFEFSVPIVERPTLARALYQVSKVGKPIPVEFFRAVAEVIAFVYRIKGYHLEKR